MAMGGVGGILAIFKRIGQQTPCRNLETRFVELDVSYGAFMRVGMLLRGRTHSSDVSVASELSLCPTMSIPCCRLSGSIPSLIVSAGFIPEDALRLLFVPKHFTPSSGKGQSKSHVCYC